MFGRTGTQNETTKQFDGDAHNHRLPEPFQQPLFEGGQNIRHPCSASSPDPSRVAFRHHLHALRPRERLLPRHYPRQGLRRHHVILPFQSIQNRIRVPTPCFPRQGFRRHHAIPPFHTICASTLTLMPLSHLSGSATPTTRPVLAPPRLNSRPSSSSPSTMARCAKP